MGNPPEVPEFGCMVSGDSASAMDLLRAEKGAEKKFGPLTLYVTTPPVPLKVFPWGFTYGSEAAEITATWGDVVALYKYAAGTPQRYSNVLVKEYFKYSFQLADGRAITFHSTLDAEQMALGRRNASIDFGGKTAWLTLEQVGKVLVDRVTREQLPDAMDRLGAGGVVKFGPLSLSPTGISYDDQLLPWDEVKSVEYIRGDVHIKKVGKRLAWKTVALHLIPNYYLFETLVSIAQHEDQR